ncbi:MAG: hypothetical protein HOF89_06420 [Candidatus Nitrosopelagicus sp.]|nr:hypothetical protein [Candidatus Nitrosopelagicus sp.]
MKKANTRIKQMQILEFSLLASTEYTKRRNQYFGINSNSFNKNWSHTIPDDDTLIDEKPEKFQTIRYVESPGRKSFRTHLSELLNQKYLTKIPKNDNRANWFSISPLGICALVQSEFSFDGLKLHTPDGYYMILTLMSFAIPNVKQYTSLIFGKAKFFDHSNDLWVDLINSEISIREELPHVLSNIELTDNGFNFFVTNGYYEENRLPLAKVSFGHDQFDKKGNIIRTNLIQVIELNKKFDRYGDSDYAPLLLDDEQFHHYFSNLILCSLIYDNIVARFDMIRSVKKKQSSSITKSQKQISKTFSELWNLYPDYFQFIVSLFSKHAIQITSSQAELMTDFISVQK